MSLEVKGARMKHKPYECPRCGYKIEKKSSMSNHLLRAKNPCPATENDILLTDEIKQYILRNRIYRIKDEVKVMNQTINNYNTMNNFVGNMDTIDKITRLVKYKQVEMNTFDDTCEQTYERIVDKMEKGTFDIRTCKPDFMDIINRLTSARDNTRDRKLHLQNLNYIYDAKKKRLRVYDGTWDDHLDNNGLEFIVNTIVDRYLEAYEIYIIRKLYGSTVLSGAEANEFRSCLKDYYQFIACFDIKPYAVEKIMQDSEHEENMRREICENLTDLYEKTDGSLTKTYLKDVRKQMLDIMKSNTSSNVSDLDRAIISIVNVQEDFKQILMEQATF